MPFKTGASKIVVMIDVTTGGTIAEVAGGMIAAVIATVATIAETTEEMTGTNPKEIAETLLRVSRLRLPLRAKEQGTTTGTTIRLKMRVCGLHHHQGRQAQPAPAQPRSQ